MLTATEPGPRLAQQASQGSSGREAARGGRAEAHWLSQRAICASRVQRGRRISRGE